MSTPARDRLHALAAPALLMGLALALYANALGNEFVFDDLPLFRKNPAIRDPSALWAALTSKGAASYRPVRTASFALDYAISGDKTWAYHLLNALYHGLTAVLVHAVIKQLTRSSVAAFCAAVLFVTHPVHTESVAYVSGRRDVLTGLFCLLGFFSYLRYREAGRWRWLGLAAVSLVLGLGVKEMAVVLPAVIFAHDLILDREALRRHAWVYAVAFALAFAAGAWFVLGGHAPKQNWHGGSIGSNFGTVAQLHAHYAGLLVAPVELLADYSTDAFPLASGFTDPKTIASLGLILTILGAALALWRRAPLVTFAVAWHAITLLPVSQIFPHHELAAEHYLYLPSVGFCLLAGLLVDRLWRVRPRIAITALVIIAALFAGRTVRRNQDWRTEETLWSATVATAPRCARAQLNLGLVRAQQGRREEAAQHVRAALAIKPQDVYGRMVLGKLLALKGDREGATAEFEEALRWAEKLDPSPVPPYVVQMALGRHEEALPRIVRFLERHPNKHETWRTLAVCLEGLGRSADALPAWRRYLAARPHDVHAARKVEALEQALERRSP